AGAVRADGTLDADPHVHDDGRDAVRLLGAQAWTTSDPAATAARTWVRWVHSPQSSVRARSCAIDTQRPVRRSWTATRKALS
ncbi:hypothetical protein SF23_21025, partial [Streptomyces sp. MBRL 10]